MGAVAYTPNVVTIWEGIRDYFADTRAEMDFVLFSNYGRQVDALLDGTIDIAWNTNLAWVRTVAQTDGDCRALAMRDTDTVFQTVFVARPGSGLDGLREPEGQTAGTGVPGLRPGGDPAGALPGATPGSEPTRSSCCASTATSASTATPAAASSTRCGRCSTTAPMPPRIGINTWESIGREELMPGAFEAFWTSPTYSHCNFTALPAWCRRPHRPVAGRCLFAMDWDNPEHRPILEMEGLRRGSHPNSTATRPCSRR